MMMWRKCVASVLVLGGVVTVGAFVGVRAALALSPGVRGGRARTALSVAGTINGGTATGATVMVDYVFLKGGAEACRVPTVLNRNVSNGHFTAEVDTERCPADLFDGSDVTVRVEAGGVSVATGPVNPVPYARYADQVGVNNDCPVGYVRDTSAVGITLCRRGLSGGNFDEVVRVGSGASAFWVDRFEASVWNDAGTQFGASRTSTSSGYMSLAPNGQWASGARDSLKAHSRRAVMPSRSLTWFQASSSCRASGKRLLRRDEWFAAADGLVGADPSVPVDGNAAGEQRCNTGGTDPRQTGQGTACQSSWGVQDMIGNVWEWTDEWYARVGALTGLPTAGSPSTTAVAGVRVNDSFDGWPSDFGGDRTHNVTSVVIRAPGEANRIGAPAAARRGGFFDDNTQAGVFAFDLRSGPADSHHSLGFRCVISR